MHCVHACQRAAVQAEAALKAELFEHALPDTNVASGLAQKVLELLQQPFEDMKVPQPLFRTNHVSSAFDCSGLQCVSHFHHALPRARVVCSPNPPRSASHASPNADTGRVFMHHMNHQCSCTI